MSIEKVKKQLESFGLFDRIREFTVSSATVELAAAALDVRPGTQHGFQRILKHGRYAAPVGLHLKPAVIRAIVGKGQ